MDERLHAIEDKLYGCDLRATANWIESLEQSNRELESALRMVLDDPESLEGRPRTLEVVLEALGADA